MGKRGLIGITISLVILTFLPGLALAASPRSAALATHAVRTGYNAMAVGIATVGSPYTPITVRVQPFAGPPAWLADMDKGQQDMGILTSAAWRVP